jgi:nuclear GTP-binding protein
MKRIYLIDCPGIVPPNQNDTPEDILLRGVVRVENVEHPEQYIPAVLAKVKQHHMERTYELKGWESHEHFLELLARRSGRLLKGGEPDLDGVAKMVLNDFMRGKIPWFTPPPRNEAGEGDVREGREGRLGEMPRKRKREDAESIPGTSMGAPTPIAEDEDKHGDQGESSGGEESEFEGFGEGKELAEELGLSEDNLDDVISLGVSSEESAEDDNDGEEPPTPRKISQGGRAMKRQRR